ncbi:uncharacterized protein [Venturia canescens]|uniref:uncharacterized protein n=1 Tax=Venturia canescens TaxID=32260 RepID=UPI001C9D3057|nr:uncharacterized protein LOC122407247 [Venturia canescens]
MPKRDCPFEDHHLLPQLKVHVGQKHVNNGVNKHREMSKVYERTLSLLKHGSKEFDRKLSINQESETKMVSPQKNHQGKTSGLKQMIFDDKLKLQSTEHNIEVSEQETCQACKTLAIVAYTRCFYCNNFKCSDCLKACTKCEEDFCNKCSLIVYEGGEHTECLACYR